MRPDSMDVIVESSSCLCAPQPWGSVQLCQAGSIASSPRRRSVNQIVSVAAFEKQSWTVLGSSRRPPGNCLLSCLLTICKSSVC